jgi:hypothetical protein
MDSFAMICEIKAGGGITTNSPESSIAPEAEMPLVSGCTTAGWDGWGSLHPMKTSIRDSGSRQAARRTVPEYERVGWRISTNESVNVQMRRDWRPQLFNNLCNTIKKKML